MLNEPSFPNTENAGMFYHKIFLYILQDMIYIDHSCNSLQLSVFACLNKKDK